MFATAYFNNFCIPWLEKRKPGLLFFIPAIFFLSVQFIIMTEFVARPDLSYDLFWYCDHISLLYFFAFYFRRSQAVIGIMQVGLVVQLLWLVDFIAHLLGINILNAADYMFVGDFGYVKIITLLIHLVIPISVLHWIGGIRPRLSSLGYSAVYICLLFSITLTLSPPEKNINCVFGPCVSFIPSWHYTFFWPLNTFMLAGVTFFGLLTMFRLLHRRSVKAG